MPARDPKRNFSQTQKKQILYQQNNKCAKCKNPLDPRTIEYHHQKPWAEGGRTISVNGIAVCSNCHSILTHEQRLKKQENKSKSPSRKKKTDTSNNKRKETTRKNQENKSKQPHRKKKTDTSNNKRKETTKKNQVNNKRTKKSREKMDDIEYLLSFII